MRPGRRLPLNHAMLPAVVLLAASCVAHGAPSAATSPKESPPPEVDLAPSSLHSISAHNLRFEPSSAEHSLSQSTVNSTQQDSKGFTWAGTYDGGLDKSDRDLLFFHMLDRLI
jgi:hypothetical protein